MPTPFLNTYFPSSTDITPDNVSQTRQAIYDIISVSFPDIDTRPNTPFGDLMLTPEAYFNAGMEIAVARLKHDLDFEAISSTGIIYDCPFVEQFVKNFNVFETNLPKSRGSVRLIFSSNTATSLNKSVLFNFSGSLFQPSVFDQNVIQILAVGSIPDRSLDQYALVELGVGVYTVDIPVEGSMTAQVTQGQVASLDTVIPNLISAAAACNFLLGAIPISLLDKVKKTSSSFYSLNFNTKKGAVNFLEQQFGDTSQFSIVSSGDYTSVRNGAYFFGVNSGVVDVYTKSQGGYVTDTVNIVVPFVYQQSTNTINRFIGKLSLPNIPLSILSIVDASNSTDVLANSDCTVYLKENSTDRMPGVLSSNTLEQNDYIIVQQHIVDGIRRYTQNVDVNTGNQYGIFSVTYLYDPTLNIVDKLLNSPDCKPLGMDIQVRSPYIQKVTQFNVTYKVDPGIVFQKTQATTLLNTYLNSLGMGINCFSLTDVSNIMTLCGAKVLLDVSYLGSINWGVSNAVIPYALVNPDSDYVTCAAGVLTIPVITSSSISGILPTYKDPAIINNLSNKIYTACHSTNTVVYSTPDKITFTEIRE